MSGLLLGIDLGTTGTKLSIFDPDRGVLASESASSPLYSDAPGWSEADTSLWWANVCALVPKTLRAAGVGPADVGGVACSGMVPAVVLLDDHGRPLRRAILQNDARAVDEIAALRQRLTAQGYDVLGATGSSLTQQSVAPTWRWLCSHEPELARQARTIVGSYEWLAMALGAQRHLETNWALESGLFELDGHWAEPVGEASGIDPALFGPVLRTGEAVGAVSAVAAGATSLREGTPIYVGGADHVLAACAAGLAAPGDWLVKLGGAGDILVVTDTPEVDQRWYLDAHPAPALWLPNGCMATSGSLLRWTQHLLGDVDLATLDAEAAGALPAQVVCLPYFLGEKSPLHDPDLRGAFVGLHLGLGRGDVFRSCMEAVAFGFRNHVDAFTERGISLGQPRISNGGSGSAVWKQIIADVTGVELLPIVDHGGASLGAAFAAGVGSGALKGWDDVASFVRTGTPVRPTPSHRDAYDEGYGVYLGLQRELVPFSHRLASLARRQSEPDGGASSTTSPTTTAP